MNSRCSSSHTSTECSSSGEVAASNELSFIPADVAKLPALTLLDMHDNRIREVRAKTFQF